jgi:5-formyltetrahydrofolate cyclo-ligase
MLPQQSPFCKSHAPVPGRDIGVEYSMQKPSLSIEEIRTRICAQRKTITPQAAASAASAACRNLLQLHEFAEARRIAVYLPVNGEIATEALIRAAWQQGKYVYLPVLQPDRSLLFTLYSPRSTMRMNRYHIPEPELTADFPPQPACAMDILIAPLVAFDRQCQRIGMGAGYYDRSLADCGADTPLRVGLAYEIQRVASIPVREWDIPMHKIVTEDGVYSREDGAP